MSIRRNSLALAAGLCAMVGLAAHVNAEQDAAAHAGHGAAGTAAQAAAGKVASAKLAPTKDNHARGDVTFTQDAKGVHVVASFTGLNLGEHGFHVHEKGDCSAPDGSSAGGHFNPDTHKHGARDAAERHAGDLGNLKADPYGLARLDFVDEKISLDGPNSIIGKAVIIHEKADDFTTQPTGNAGGRLACGVIEAGAAKK